MKQYMALLIAVGCFYLVQAQPTFTAVNFIEDDNNNYLKSFEGETSDSARVYLQAEFEDGTIIHSRITEKTTTHNVSIIFPKRNSVATIKAVAFNVDGTTESDVLATIEKSSAPELSLIGENVEGYEKPLLNEYVLLNTETEIPAEKQAIILSPDGGIAWSDTLPNSNENVDCNAINYQNGYILITDCHTITRKKLDGSDEKIYQFEADSLSGTNSFFHGEAIINIDGNVVSLFAHKNIVDQSLIGGNSETDLVSDGIVEFDFETGEIINLYSPPTPIEEGGKCNFLRVPLLSAKGGKYAPVFGDDISYYRLATSIVQNSDSTYHLTMDTGILLPQGGISNVSLKNRDCELFFNFISPNSQDFLFYEDDLFLNPRSFSVLPNGNFFMLTNYPDTTIVANDTMVSQTSNGTTTRALKFFLEPFYNGYYTMFRTLDDYILPTEAYTETGSAIWLPTDEMLSFSPTNKTLYRVTDENAISGALQFNENISVGALVDEYIIEIPQLTIMNIDTLVCNDLMEMYELEGMPEGGYFTGVPVTGGNIFDPTGLETGSTYTITYNYGPYTADFEIEVEKCVSINELMHMGGLDSEISPNPIVEGQAMLKYQLSKPGEVQLQIVNLNGQLIKNIDLGFRRAGISAEMIDLSSITSPGAYIYSLISNNMISSKRFIFTK